MIDDVLFPPRSERGWKNCRGLSTATEGLPVGSMVARYLSLLLLIDATRRVENPIFQMLQTHVDVAKNDGDANGILIVAVVAV